MMKLCRARVSRILFVKPQSRSDVSRKVTIECHASLSGLGASLLHEGHPTDTYLYGRDIAHVKTYHQPLEAVFKKGRGSASKRLQRMLWRLQRYNLDVKYQKV